MKTVFKIQFCLIALILVSCQRKFATLVANQRLVPSTYFEGNVPYFLSDIDSLDNSAPVALMVMEPGRPREKKTAPAAPDVTPPSEKEESPLDTLPKAEEPKNTPVDKADTTTSAMISIPTPSPSTISPSAAPPVVSEAPAAQVTEATEKKVEISDKATTSPQTMENTSTKASPLVEDKEATEEPERTSIAEPIITKTERSSSSSELNLPTIMEEDLFEINAPSNKTTVVYENIDYPQNSVFSIQIGAFSKPIATDFYEDFSPVIAEQLNDQLKRYTVGLFVSQVQARQALRKIRNMGYQDAFIIVHDNGKRMTLQQWKNR